MGAARPPTKATCAIICAFCLIASNAINTTIATISTNTIGAGSSGCSFNAAKAVRYITATPKPCNTRPYSRLRLCSFQPPMTAAKPAPATVR